MNFENFTYTCNLHSTKDKEHFHVPRKFPLDPFQSITTASPCSSVYFIGGIYGFHNINTPQFIHSPTDGYVYCFQFWANMNKAASIILCNKNFYDI